MPVVLVDLDQDPARPASPAARDFLNGGTTCSRLPTRVQQVRPEGESTGETWVGKVEVELRLES